MTSRKFNHDTTRGGGRGHKSAVLDILFHFETVIRRREPFPEPEERGEERSGAEGSELLLGGTRNKFVYGR